jgi:hypothetical protein
MNIEKNDLAIVEQAIRCAMNQTSDYQEVYAYQGILDKILSNKNNLDGFRYDYDDSSDFV